jgi:formylglycine-generating enzyme required for sulfatase activity
LRVGSFAGATTTREQAGATYYGVMEMSGNCWEWVVDVARATGRSYTGVHGDGSLSAAGDYNATNWPNRGGIRGGSWGNTALRDLNVSDRANVVGDYYTQRYNTTSGRAVRTAP